MADGDFFQRRFGAHLLAPGQWFGPQEVGQRAAENAVVGATSTTNQTLLWRMFDEICGRSALRREHSTFTDGIARSSPLKHCQPCHGEFQ
jgi:hypothetical protein